MKCIIKIICIILLLFATILPKGVDIKKAEQVAINWLIERSEFSAAQISVKETFTINESTIAIYYVFNMNPSGFVIVSSDDIVYPVIGYSFTENYSTENQPPQFVSWMKNVKDQINSTVKLNLEPSTSTTREWLRIMVDPSSFVLKKKLSIQTVGPLIKTSWDQGDPYNKKCPSVYKSSNCVTGCSATATCQIMKYYSYPTRGRYDNQYNDPPHYDKDSKEVVKSYGIQSANFGTTTYSWSNMPYKLSSGFIGIGSSSQKEIDAVSTLLYHCGVAMHMDYESDEYGSGAPQDSTRYALVNFFDYSIEAADLKRDDNLCSEDQWIELMKQELDAGRPVLYFGFNEEYNSGHAFIMDGYQADASFHFNFGWSGWGDTYLSLNSITPVLLWIVSQGDFSYHQSAIINIKAIHNSIFRDKTPVLFIYQDKWTALEDGGTTDPIFLINLILLVRIILIIQDR